MRAKLPLLAVAVLLCVSVAAAGEQLAHAIYVKVNGKTITQENVLEAVRYLVKREFRGIVPEDEEELDNLQKAALRDLVRTILIHDEAAREGVRVDRVYSRQAMAQSGLSPEEITPTIRRMLEADDLFEDLMARSGTPINNPSPSQIRKFYTDNKEDFRSDSQIIVRTIFIAADSSSAQAVFKAKAERVMEELQAVPPGQRTAAFAKKAGEISEDVFAQHGGLLTGDMPDAWIPKDFNNLNPEGEPIFPVQMVEVIRRLNRAGELRLAVSSEGMHIMYCEDVRGGRLMPFDEASRIIDYILKSDARNRRMRAWLSRVYDRSDVRWHDGTPYEKETLTEVLLPSERHTQGG
jgi:hypothetical protein